MVLVGCAADEETSPTIESPVVMDQPRRDSKGDEAGPDLCALALDLPEGDICRNLCDPDAIAAQLEAEGGDRGACYTLYCQLTDSQHAIVGVCLAP
jgi:hypothetical protein